MKDILNFITDIKNRSLETIQQEQIQADCEVFRILHLIQNNKEAYANYCATLYTDCIQNQYFTLKHPLYANITCYAVYSFNDSFRHILFMIDEHNKYPFIAVQLHHIFDLIILPNGLIPFPFMPHYLRGDIPSIASHFCSVDTLLLTFGYKKFAFSLIQARPFHYFFEVFPAIFQIYKVCKSPLETATKSFFIPKITQKTTKKAEVLIRPAIHSVYSDDNQYNKTIPFIQDLLRDSYARFKELVESVDRDKISKLATLDFFDQTILSSVANNGGGGAEEMYSLTLWIGIPGERRIWLEQWEGIPLILKNLSHYFPSIKVYVDGMTAYDGERIEVKDNLEAFWKIVENTKEVFEVPASLRGMSGANDEAIHNQAKSNFNNGITTGEIKDYRLPRDSNESLAMTKSQPLRHCERSEAIHNTESRPQDSKNSCVIYGAKGEQIAFKSLSGYDYRTKICYCAMCDIVISETSTTSLVPFYFCKKPGVAFYCVYDANNRVHINMARDFAKQIPHLKVPLPKYHHYEGGVRSGSCFNYHLPPEHLYNLAAESLEELSLEGKLANFDKDNPLKMHRLSVPPVELYSKLYELEKKTQVSLKGNKAEAEILEKIESQKKLLEMQKLLCESAQRSEIAPSTKEAQKPRGAKERVHHHLAYKLGVALIVCSKSLWGYITMPYILSYIKAQHQFTQEKYQKAVARNPALKLPKLESYADYEDALKEQQCYTYKLGQALMEADKTWLKGGYLWFYLESKRLKREFERERG